MFHVLILGGNKGINLYFLSDNSIKAVFCSTEFDIKELTNFDAAVVVCGNLSDLFLRTVEHECRRLGIPIFYTNEKDCRTTIDGHRILETIKVKIDRMRVQSEDLFIGHSAAIQKLKRNVNYLSKQNCSIFIVGETGTGKEVLADLIFRKASNFKQAFIKINCAAIPPGLAESQMFGSEVGAYTDAVSFAGFLEKAHGGTLFLDEIPDLPVELQSKFLRVLEEKTFFRIGGKKKIDSEFRLITASNRPRSELFRNDGFRSDLYYRIAECVLEIPPLRERLEDIPLLCYHFLSVGNKCLIADSAIEKLMSHRWPGNVRELKNVLIRSEINAADKILRADDILF